MILLFCLLPTVLAASPVVVKPISIHAVAATGATVDFETDVPADARLVGSCRPTENPQGEPERVDFSVEDHGITRHTLRVEGNKVQPNQLCRGRVRVGVGKASLDGPPSPSDLHFSFWTAPPNGSPLPFTFAVVGDSREHASWATVAKAIEQMSPRFLLVTGDAVDGASAADWREYYSSAASLFATTPVFAVRGNHDALDGYAAYNLDPPARIAPSTYRFVYGNAGFLALDSNSPSNEEQRAFAARALPALSGGPLFVFQHHPLYSCGSHRGSDEMRRVFEALFIKARVTVDFSGHDHDLILWKPQSGVEYVVSGGGGSRTYPLSRCEDARFARQGFGFVLVKVDGARVTLRYLDEQGGPLFGPLSVQAAGNSVPGSASVTP